MGYPNHELITPAVLLDNSGLTKIQLTQKLSKIHFSTQRYEEDVPLDIHDHDFSPSDLGDILSLKLSRAYENFMQPTIDTNGLSLDAPVWGANMGNSASGIEASIKVIKHVRNDLGVPQMVQEWEVFDAELGDVVTRAGKDYVPLDCLITGTVGNMVQIQEIQQIREEEVFPSLEEMYRAWPQFRPENMYDFSQDAGHFNFFYGGENFLWKFVDGKYYLDPTTYDRLSVSFWEGIRNDDKFEFGYTDLILTAEAIKHGAWKLLSRGGLSHLEPFLKAFPDSRARHEKAVYDAYTSLYAKKKQMTVTDFLKMRLTPFAISEEDK